MSKKKKKRRAPSRGGWLAIGAVVIVAILLAVLSPKTVKDNDLASSAFKLEVTAESDFVINEIMASNASALVMPDGSLPDWIEITNTGNKAHSLSGYVLMLDSEADNMYRLPDVQVAAGESVVVYCDARPGDMHAPFGLPAAGATAILMDVSGDVVDRVSYPALQDNRVYCRDGGEWVISSVSTPGADNVVSDRDSGETTRVTVASQVQISEIMTKNVSYIPDVNGNVHDYIEIENTGSGDINLKGWHLSD
ncbi:MAG: lamin tail domain-containing protein, partial [Clostridia bacterium]|nr:lamin tail domain-containing protein [Clostridia bacterium]